MTYGNSMVGKRLVQGLARARAAAALIVANLLIVFCIFATPACTSTVAPKTVEASAPSFDAGQANGGFLGYQPDGSGLITSHARDRYNGLIAIYGGKFIPPLLPDAGVQPGQTNGTWRIDAEHLEKFARMNRWRKQEGK